MSFVPAGGSPAPENAGTGVSCSSASHCIATSPAGSGTVDILVTTVGGTSGAVSADRFTYTGVPAITEIAPSVGAAGGGTTVVITGTGFVTATGATTIKFGNAIATNVVCASTTTCTLTSAVGSGTVHVTATTVGGTSATGTADQFSYVPSPVVSSISPSVGPVAGGTVVTISGANFFTTTGETTIAFGGSTATGVSCSSTT